MQTDHSPRSEALKRFIPRARQKNNGGSNLWKKLVALLLACMLILAAAAAMAEPSGTVMLYSS